MRILIIALAITSAFLWGMHFGYKLAVGDIRPAFSESTVVRPVAPLRPRGYQQL